MRSFYFCLLLLLLLTLPACYHMRAEVEPINARVIEVKADPADAMLKIRKLVEVEWQNRILETDISGSILTTAPYHFYTDTGAGMPAGGRKYYTQLRIEISQRSGQAFIQVSPYNFEMRTSYAYSQDGRLGTLYKHYPYQHYPGMFDLTRINNELDRVAGIIKTLFR